LAVEPTLYLVDGSGYIFRAFYAVPRLTSSTGMPTNAVMGFTRMLRSLLEKESPDYVAVAFDTKERGFRADMYPQYKAHRPPPPPDLVPQFPYFRKVVEALNIPTFAVAEYEADDIIGTLVERSRDWGMRAVVVSGDKDLMQLVDERTVMIDPMKGRTFGPAEVEQKFGVPPNLVADALGLAGDSSDNIPGVPGIGGKTAAALLQAHGSLEGVLAAAPGIKGKRGENLREFAEQARLSRRLTVIVRDVPLDIDREALRLTAPDIGALRALYTELDFHRFLAELAVEAGEEEEAPASALGETHEYRCLLSLDEIRVAVAEARRAEMVAYDTETTSTDPMQAKLVGISLAWEPGKAVYIPVGHYYAGCPEQPDLSEVLDALRPLLEDGAVPKTAQNHKYDWKVMRRHGVDVVGVVEDPMLSSYLLNPGRLSHGMDNLALEFLNHQTIKYKEVTDGVRGAIFSGVSVAKATEYSGEDSDVTLRLAGMLRERVDEAGLSSLRDDVELPLARVLGVMEMNGMLVDGAFLEGLSVEFAERIEVLQGEIHELAGREFTINSTQQLGEILFDELGLPVVKRTKTLRSTDQSVLEELKSRHLLPAKVLAYRHLAKLKSTYVDALPGAIHPETGRVHSSFKQTVAATGRLSSDSPNLQNIPVRTEEGRRIRRAFIAPEGHLLLSADYSQVELRILAHLSGDQGLIDAFHADEDIHQATAAEIFNVFPTMVSKEQRSAAKAINFGIMYGMSAFRLAREQGIPRKEAKEFIDRYFIRYSGVKAFIDDTLAAAREKGFVTTLLGRRRYLPDLQARGPAKGRAEREAVNTPVQGTAADILKLGMVAIGESIEAGELPAKMVLTVHDELLFEVEEARVDEVGSMVREAMEGIVELAVPLKVDLSSGVNWAEAK
jgi:DNA polymerase-1